jgi:hypothetical protein
MDFATSFFKAMCSGVDQEIKQLIHEQNKILRSHNLKPHPADVISKIFQELTLRYVALKTLYQDPELQNVHFECEHVIGARPIDVVFFNNQNGYAFELKRWQTPAEVEQITGKDRSNLLNFINSENNHKGFELIYTIVKQDMDDEQHKGSKSELFANDFNETLGDFFNLIDCKVITEHYKVPFDICIYLAEPRKEIKDAAPTDLEVPVLTK